METIINGNPKELDCDISSSDSAKLVSNGVNIDFDNTKSIKSDEEHVALKKCENKSEGKHASEKKKDKKSKAADDKDSDKKKESAKNKNTENVKKDETATKNSVPINFNGDGDSITNGEKDRESSPSEDGDDKKRDAEVVFIQDLGFNVKIVSPGAEPLDIQV